ncbi:hypothetical protein J3R30DRAFT_1341470 [Lentinula aciculospora]|uniref:Uncharacterized protein n=1 Tax=Lentinula aciculospora TaxID=153920 RepID=A0A9W9AL51_9AGAR|nr:hypothetical protein J3R30DRAFT_1341470 [Lentinula aciculospora]
MEEEDVDDDTVRPITILSLVNRKRRKLLTFKVDAGRGGFRGHSWITVLEALLFLSALILTLLPMTQYARCASDPVLLFIGKVSHVQSVDVVWALESGRLYKERLERELRRLRVRTRRNFILFLGFWISNAMRTLVF